MRVEDFLFKLQESRAHDIAANLSHQNAQNIKDLTQQLVTNIGKNNLQAEVNEELSEKIATIYNQYLSNKDLNTAKNKMENLFRNN